MLERLRGALAFGMNPTLDTERALLAELGDPHRVPGVRAIQVTGTNGKTSTVRAIEALLRAQGLRTGLYTSPDLVEYRERICVDGTPLTWDAFTEAVQAALQAGEAVHTTTGVDVTEFELLTAAAFHAFATARVDWSVLEVGLGGRWDATSVVEPAVSVITGVSLDHTHVLGSTREEIAADKAHIIKGGAPAVIGPATDGVVHVIEARAAEQGSPLVAVAADDSADASPSVGPVPRPTRDRCSLALADLASTAVTVHATGVALPLRAGHSALETIFSVRTSLAEYPHLRVDGPAYQATNVAIALTAVELALGRALDLGSVHDALAGLTFPGRLEVITTAPTLIFDGGHNPEAAAHLAAALGDIRAATGKPVIVALGVFADKDAAGIVAALAPAADSFIAIAPDSPRALSAAALAAAIERGAGRPPIAVLEHPSLAEITALTSGSTAVLAGSLSLYHLLESNGYAPG